jgi:sigma-B regulation protein RsbU (phosphoserine phosphatase)
VMYTDGVTDAVNAANDEFGEERLEALVCAKCGATAEEVIADIDRAVTEFAGGRQQFDDFTLLVLRRG